MEDNNNVTYDLTGKKIIPLNAPIGFANETPPTTLPFQAVEKGQSVSEGLCAAQGVPYYNEDGTINVNSVATNLKMILDMYNTISQPVALLSMGAIPEWSQSVRDNNGGYPKDFVIRGYDTTGYWVYYQSLIDNNMNDKPILASHVGWDIIGCYQLRDVLGIINRIFGYSTYAEYGAQGYYIKDKVTNNVTGEISPGKCVSAHFESTINGSKLGGFNPNYTIFGAYYDGEYTHTMEFTVVLMNGKVTQYPLGVLFAEAIAQLTLWSDGVQIPDDQILTIAGSVRKDATQSYIYIAHTSNAATFRVNVTIKGRLV